MREAPAQSNRTGECGQAGVFVVLNLTLLFAVLGLTVDVGWSYYKRHAAQSSADAAALAAAVWAGSNGTIVCGSNGLVCGTVTSCAYPNVTTPSTPLQEACLYAQANGFVNTGTQSVSAEANTSPNAPPGVSGNVPAVWVLVNVSESPFTLFGNFAGVGSFNVNAQAISGANPAPSSTDIYVLSSSASPSLHLSGTGSLSVSGSGVYVDSNAANALYAQGSSSVTASSINVHGSDSVTGGSTACANAGGSCVLPTTSAPTVADPLGTTSLPTWSGCDHTNYSVSAGTPILPHGNYCGGITITGTASVSLSGGQYFLVGGGLSVGNSGSISGTGVTIFMTGNSTYAAAPFVCTGSATVTLSSATSGSYRGFLFYQDRSANGTYAATNSIGNSCVATLTGTLYFPTTSLTLSGAGSGSSTTTSIVANTLIISGSASYKNDTTGAYSALTNFSSALIN